MAARPRLPDHADPRARASSCRSSRRACRYLRPARVDDLLTVRATLASVGPASFAFDYEVAREDGLLLVTGWTRLAVCERETARACAMPAWLRDLFADLPVTVQD